MDIYKKRQHEDDAYFHQREKRIDQVAVDVAHLQVRTLDLEERVHAISDNLTEVLEEFCRQKGLRRFEGASGVITLSTVVEALGYKRTRDQCPIQLFLEDNPGALEALFQWIGDRELPQWREALSKDLKPS